MARPISAAILAIREMFKDTPLVGAEIGVYLGDNAEFILEVLNMQKLYLIDPFDPDNDFEGYCKPKLGKVKQLTLDKLLPYAAAVEWLFHTSDDALPFITEPLHFVYIDGNHSYAYVKRDLENYWKLVMPGGVVSGHDYATRKKPPIEARLAVDEFVAAHNLDLTISREFDPHMDWWFRKPLHISSDPVLDL